MLRVSAKRRRNKAELTAAKEKKAAMEAGNALIQEQNQLLKNQNE
jgi:hypothetical protein